MKDNLSLILHSAKIFMSTMWSKDSEDDNGVRFNIKQSSSFHLLSSVDSVVQCSVV